MAITFVQASKSTTVANAPSVSVTLGTVPTIGNMILLGTVLKGSALNADATLNGNPTGTASTSLAGIYNTVGTVFVSLKLIPVKGTGTGAVTLTTTSGANTTMAVVAAEFQGTNLTPVQFSTTTGNSQSLATGTLTNLTANVLFVGVLGTRGTFAAEQTAWFNSGTLTNSFINPTNGQTSTSALGTNLDGAVGFVYRVVSSISSYGTTADATAIPSNNWATALYTFRELTTGGAQAVGYTYGG